MKYFENFPEIVYEGKRVKDITRRNRFIRNLQNNPLLYLPYTVKEGERPEDVANFYYGSPDYVWLVLMANNMTDPYHDWPLSTNEFHDFIIEKYTEVSGETGQDVIDWTQSDETEDNIVYYYREV